MNLIMNKRFLQIFFIASFAFIALFLMNKYHYAPIKRLNKKVDEQEVIISNLQAELKKQSNNFKNKLFECENNSTQKFLIQEIKRIDNEKNSPSLDTSNGNHTITF